jgi:hypothetical protein
MEERMMMLIVSEELIVADKKRLLQIVQVVSEHAHWRPHAELQLMCENLVPQQCRPRH